MDDVHIRNIHTKGRHRHWHQHQLRARHQQTSSSFPSIRIHMVWHSIHHSIPYTRHSVLGHSILFCIHHSNPVHGHSRNDTKDQHPHQHWRQHWEQHHLLHRQQEQPKQKRTSSLLMFVDSP